MADLIARLKLANSEFNKNVDSSKQKISELQDTADDASKSLKDMGDKGAKSTADFLKEMGKVEEGGRSVTNYKKQLAQLNKQIVDLTLNYRGMTDEMKNSVKGVEIKQLLDEATQQAANMKDAIMDVNQEINNMASDTAVWDGMKMGIDTVSSSLQAFVATGVLGEKSTEKLVAVIAKLKAIEAATNAVIKIGNALQKNSALMTSLNTIKTKIQTAATKKATVAQAGLNATMLANPIFLVVAAIAALAAGLIIYSRNADKATASQNKYNKVLEGAKLSATDNIAKFKLLSAQYKTLKTDAEKTQWIKNNTDKFNELGLSINSINDAQKALIDNADKFIRVLTLEAEVAALNDYYQEEYKKGIEDSIKAQKKATNAASDFWGLTQREIKKYGLKEGEDYVITWKYSTNADDLPQKQYDLTPEGKAKLKKAGEDAANAINDGVEAGLKPVAEMMANKQAEAANIRTSFGTGSGGGGNNNNNKKEREAIEGSKKALEEKLAVLQNELPYLIQGTEEWKNQLSEIDKVKAAIEEINKQEVAYTKRITTEVLPIPKLPEIKGKAIVQPEITPEQMNKTYKEACDKANELSQYVKIGAISSSKAKTMIDELNKKLAELGITAKVELDLEVNEQEIKTIKDEFDGIGEAFSKVSEVGNAVTAINSVYEAFKSLQDTINDDEKDGWQKFFATFQMGMTIFSSAAQIIQAVGTAIEIFNAIKESGVLISLASALATKKEAKAHEENAHAAITDATASGIDAAMKGGQSVAWIPYVGAALALAMIASITALVLSSVSSAQKFAGGGIVGGSSYSGDKIMVGVNSGEMILNDKQQAHLFKMLDEGRTTSIGNGNVEFKIRGTELVGVLNNYSNKTNRI